VSAGKGSEDLMARNVYRVVPDGSVWSVKFLGSVLSSHAVKEDAVQQGRKFAIANQPSQLVAHRADGTIEFEWT
jgi:hypothetical protein